MPSCSLGWPRGRSSPGALAGGRKSQREKTPEGKNPTGTKPHRENTPWVQHPAVGRSRGQGVRLCPLTPVGTGAARFVGLTPPGTGLRVASVPSPSFLPSSPRLLWCATASRSVNPHSGAGCLPGLAAPGPITSALFIRAATKERGGDAPGLPVLLPTPPEQTPKDGLEPHR